MLQPLLLQRKSKMKSLLLLLPVQGYISSHLLLEHRVPVVDESITIAESVITELDIAYVCVWSQMVSFGFLLIKYVQMPMPIELGISACRC